MSHELKQGNSPSGDTNAAFVDDRSGNNSLHMQSNSRVLTTWIGKITQTSPGVLQGMGGDTTATLPSGAVPVNFNFYSPLQASTGATITVGLDTTSTFFLNASSVATLALGKGQQSPVSVTNLFAALAGLPVGTAHTLTGFYSETATSGSGGPFFIEIDYYVPSPA